MMMFSRFLVQVSKTINCKNDSTAVYVVGVGIVHMVLTCWVLTETIEELFYEQEPVEMNTITYIVAHFLFQAFLVLSLLTGTAKNIAALLLPWLLATALLFTLATVYTVLQFTRERFLWNNVKNIIISGLFWLTWWMVFNLFGKFRCHKKYKYQKLSTIDSELDDSSSVSHS